MGSDTGGSDNDEAERPLSSSPSGAHDEDAFTEKLKVISFHQPFSLCARVRRVISAKYSKTCAFVAAGGGALVGADLAECRGEHVDGER